MKPSRAMLVAVIAGALTMPVLAQPSEQEARQAAESVVEAHNQAVQKKDAAGLAALYADDAFVIAPEGTIAGRAAIQKFYEQALKDFTSSAKLDRVQMIGEGIRVRSGSWAGAFQAANGPVQLKGYWATTDVLDRGTWKIRMESFNVSPPPSPPDAKQ
jgi:uncharacterized protein (TIGR02246 family)